MSSFLNPWNKIVKKIKNTKDKRNPKSDSVNQENSFVGLPENNFDANNVPPSSFRKSSAAEGSFIESKPSLRPMISPSNSFKQLNEQNKSDLLFSQTKTRNQGRRDSTKQKFNRKLILPQRQESPLYPQTPITETTPISQVLSEKLSLQLPIDELNISLTQSNVLLSITSDKISSLEDSLALSEKIIENNNYEIQEIKKKSQLLVQTAEIANEKLRVLDRKIDNVVFQTKNGFSQVISFFCFRFFFLQVLFLLIWENFATKK